MDHELRIDDIEHANSHIQAFDEEEDIIKKRMQLEHVDVQEVTKKILRMCKVVRDKSQGSRVLSKKTGIVCGAREGSRAVNEPLMKYKDL